MDDCGRKYAYSHLKARHRGKIDCEAIQELLRDTCGLIVNSEEAKILFSKIAQQGSEEISEADFERMIQRGRRDPQGYLTLWNRIKDGGAHMSIDCLDDFIRNGMKLNGVDRRDVRGYVSYMGLANHTEIDYDTFRKM